MKQDVFENKRTLKVLIVGLGKVAIAYDYEQNNSSPKSHIYSILHFANLNNLTIEYYFVDPNRAALLAARSRIPDAFLFESLADLPSINFQLAINCTPIGESTEITRQIIRGVNFELLILEKPSASSEGDVSYINNLVNSGINSYIVYPRRALQSTQILKGLIDSSNYNSWDVEVEFSGSFKNIAVHFIDLCEFFFGDLESYSFAESTFLGRNDRISRLIVKNTGLVNSDDHRMSIRGPIEIEYRRGGLEVEVRESPSRTINLPSDVEFQILRTVESYMSYFLYGAPVSFSKVISNALGYIISNSEEI